MYSWAIERDEGDDMSIITRIEEVDFSRGQYDKYSGFAIDTEDTKILFGINNGPQCCEVWGYVASDDDLQSFVGADLLGVKLVDEGLNVRVLDEVPELDCGGAMFLNLETSRGTLQFTAYNAHNGYYSHDAVYIVNDVVEEQESL